MVRYNYFYFLRLTGLVCLLLLSLGVQQASAQLGIGFSSERRALAYPETWTGEPEFGLGVRLENSFPFRFPRLRLAWRLHASVFSSQNSFQARLEDFQEGAILKSELIDYGFGVFAELPMPLRLHPYIGLGAGVINQRFNVLDPEVETPLKVQASRGNYYWSVGAKFKLLPVIHPFVEYRYNNDFRLFDNDLKASNSQNFQPSDGRLLLGVIFDF